jgi:hypothetical protein
MNKSINCVYLKPNHSHNISSREYVKICLWEYDFLKEYIFSDFDLKVELEYVSDCLMGNLNNPNVDVLVINSREIPYNESLEIVKNITPKILILTSDECGDYDPRVQNIKQFNNLSVYCDLLVRQYHHFGYEYSNNVTIIPLGYNNNFLDNFNFNVPKINERFYNWTHFGYLKSDRYEMLNCFSDIHTHYSASGIPTNEVRDYYLNSIFVPCGRGNISLNCYRLYEASMVGAIPVVVASKEEFDVTFKYEENPPWLRFESWQEASKECKILLEQKDKLQQIQDDLLKWWQKRVSKVKDQIKDVLDGSVQDKLENFPPVNIISITESADRRKKLYKMFETYGVSDITVNVFERYNDDDHKILGKDVDKLVEKNQRGPVTSHLKAIKNWYENTDEEYAFFCEDDISFDAVKYWNFTWEEFFDSLPKDWECVQLALLSTHDYYMDRIITNNTLRPRDWCDWSCCAYLIKRSHAKRLVESYFLDDAFVLDYKGSDVYRRNDVWTIRPTPETIVYTYFFDDKDTNFVFSLFLEGLDNISTWTDNDYREVDNHHNYSHTKVLEWWKTIGKNTDIKQIMSYN